MEGIGQGIGAAIITLCIICVLIFWAGYELVDWIFISEDIRVEQPIKPEIELIIKDNKVDTIYVYRHP